MNNRISLRLVLIAFVVALLVGAGRSATVLPADLTPQAYLPTIHRAGTALAGEHNAWSLTGNADTDPSVNFLGTTDGQPLIIQPGGADVGIGTKSPAQRLHVSGTETRLRLQSTARNTWTTTEYVTDARTWHAGVGGSQVENDLRSKFYIFDGTPGAARMVIDTVGRVGIGTTSPAQSLHVSGQDSRLRLQSTRSDIWTTTEYVTDARAWHTGVGGSTVANDVKSKYYIFDSSAGVFRMVIDTIGNVGIGTTAPRATLSVVKAGAAEPNVQNVPTGLKVGTPAGTIPLALRHNGTEDGTPGLAYFETASGDLGYLGAGPGTFAVGAAAGKGMALNVNGSTTAMSAASDGRIGIGVVPQSGVRLGIRSTGTANSTSGLAVYNGNGDPMLVARDDGKVWIGHLQETHLRHVCVDSEGGSYLETCRSAAEYVPTIDGGQGFPETADLVSIAPSVANPYGDTHGPFVVQKADQACDANLLGFIVDPELGADGVKLNDHYLPLAIFGYFPAKVTLDYGPIKRGDPLTSSPKPGYAMKATGACKIIGYALEDAKADGTIQVFAHLSETAASQVTALQAQVDTLLAQVDTLQREKQTEIATLKAQNAALEARLAALERALTTNTAARPPLQR